MENQIKRLIYRSKNRGCKEMDIILGHFASGAINDLNNNELSLYEELLDEADNDIWNWVAGIDVTPAKYDGLIKKVANEYQ